MLNSQHSAVVDEPCSHKQLPEVLHLKAIIASHHSITIQSYDQLQVLRVLHLSLRLQNPVKDSMRNQISSGHNSIKDRILLESIPSTSDALCRYIAAMKANQLITVTYR